MIVSFDEDLQERDCTVLFKFIGEFDICVTVIEVVKKLGCCVFIIASSPSCHFLRRKLSCSYRIEELFLYFPLS